MKISVVIINYNYAEYVPLAIRSVLNQISLPDQIIVIDDGSTDNSASIISSLVDNSDIIFHRKENGGQLSAVRSGVNLADGDWIFFLDSDDEWHSNHLSNAKECIEGNPDVSMYFSDHRETSGTQLFRSKWPEGKIGPCSGLVAVTGTRIGTIESTLGLRANLARASISFDTAVDNQWRMRAEDCLIFGASLSGAVAYYNPAPTVSYRIHGKNAFANNHQSDSRQYLQNKKELFDYWINYYRISKNELNKLILSQLRESQQNRSSRALRRRSARAVLRLPIPLITRWWYALRCLLTR